MSAEELLRRYAAGERDFPGVDLSNANLNIAGLEDYEPGKNDLSGINLSGANLEKASINCVNLSGANLQSANLTGASLYAMALIDADLSDAILDYAEISADLTDAIVRGAILECTGFYRADLTRTDFTGAYFLGVSGESPLEIWDTIMPDGKICNSNNEFWSHRLPRIQKRLLAK
jgi:uncharacterized protein YjbI with pentapeptide repeats